MVVEMREGGTLRRIRDVAMLKNGDGGIEAEPLATWNMKTDEFSVLESDESRRAKRFAVALRDASNLPVHLFDERLSSYDADLKMRDRELTRKQRRNRRDALAATAILADFLAAGPPDGPDDATR